jgi:hypothetical protein
VGDFLKKVPTFFARNFSKKVSRALQKLLNNFILACASVFFYGDLDPAYWAPHSGRKYSRLGRKLACFRGFLFSPFSPSLSPPPAALGLEASFGAFGFYGTLQRKVFPNPL